MGLKQLIKRPWGKGKIFWDLPVKEPMIALTFDDGPHPDITPKVLDILAAKGAKATFFCVGKAARVAPELVKRIVAEGHTLACHTDTHADLSKIGTEASRSECKESREVLEQLGNCRVRYLRPPWGRMAAGTLPVIWSSGMTAAMWSFDSLDYEHLSPVKLLERVKNKKPGPGTVTLFHDDGENTLNALPEIIDELHGRGLKCVNLDTMMQAAFGTLRP